MRAIWRGKALSGEVQPPIFSAKVQERVPRRIKCGLVNSADHYEVTLGVERTFWEKASILHAIHHNDKLRTGVSRHYYDVLMLDRAGIAQAALARLELLDRVVANKSVMFADRSASYETAVLGSLRLLPSGEGHKLLERDYADMSEMFMEALPSLDELIEGLHALEAALNAGRSKSAPASAKAEI